MSLELTSKETQINFKMREVSEHRVYEFEDFRLEADHLLLFRGRQQLALTPKVVETLLVLIERHGEVISKDELMQALWPETAVEEGNLSQNLYILRKALGKMTDGQPYIETLRRRGYRFAADVSLSGPQFKTHNAARHLRIERSNNIYSVVDWQQAGKDQFLDRPNSRAKNFRSAIAIVAALLFAAFGFAVFRFVGGSESSASVAVIPFRDKVIERITTTGQVKRAAISPDGRYVSHVTENAEGSSLSLRNVAGATDVRIAGPSPSEFVWTAFAPDSNSVFYLSLDRDKGDTELFRVPVLGGPALRAAYDTGPVGFSPDGQSIVFIRMYYEETRLIVAGVDGSNERVLATKRQPEYFSMIWNSPAWSPDGSTIACPVRLSDGAGQYETVIGIDADVGSERQLTTGRWHEVGQPQWLGDDLVLTASERTTSPQQIWHISSRGGTPTRITRDLNDYYDLSVTTDGSRLSAMQSHVVSGIWIVQDGKSDPAKSIASEVGWQDDLAWLSDSRIAYISHASGSSEIWAMNADGSDKKQITTGALAGRGITVSHDKQRIIFSSERSGRPNIWSVSLDGHDLRQLTSGDGEFYPQCTPDGQWIVIQRGVFDPTLWKIPATGGEPVQLSRSKAMRPSISPDGSMIAFHYLDSKLDRSQWGIGIIPVVGGVRTHRFDFPQTVVQRLVRWAPDAISVAFANAANGYGNIWLQPIAGGQPVKLTDFKSEDILAFDWSPSGRTLAVSRSVETRDVVMITDFLSD